VDVLNKAPGGGPGQEMMFLIALTVFSIAGLGVPLWQTKRI